ncbi:protealysin inhibitor emfourin [Phycicoccus flavus]|uniref:protealysin inhibitor emfourin n=1 Tax=Phycicoccus flavus TaxID=2502783 RepID=UPI000FEC06A6|nr:protealysin inhibitor emfourin [Phycicoccus flavus]NHA70045.1 M4 family metallopeptidase [Phycicoccus flavus]
MTSSAAPREPHRCSIVPPYLLAALAASGDTHVSRSASETLRVDDLVRRGRVMADARPETRGTPPHLAPGTDAGPRRAVHDAQQGTTLPGVEVRAEGGPETGDEAVTQAYDGLGATWRLWHEAYGRNSLDGKGLPLVASVHYGRDYDNAFWDGTQMVFGDGDGTIFLGFTRSVDVIGHELAHGVTQYTSGLNYQGQSGALNESVSDVFGVLVKQYQLGQTADEADWLVGAELLAPGVQGRALRSMAAPGTAYDDPRLGRDPQPAHMDGYVETSDDNGGVHTNSGIPNKAFHDLAVALGGHAWEVAGQVWYDTVLGQIRADCDFATFAGLTHSAAVARYGEGSREAAAVAAAWAGVGLPVDGPARPADAGTDGADGTQAPSGDGPDLPPAPDTPPGPYGEPPADTPVTVRRTGGVAGIVRERTVVIGMLQDSDTRRWQMLLAEERFQVVAESADDAARSRPDAFCYGVACAMPLVDVQLPEPALDEDLQALLERTLDATDDDPGV